MSLSNIDITSANAVGILTVDQLFPAGIQLQMFGSDQSVSEDAVQISETRMSVDGHMVAGYTPVIHPVTIVLEAPSPSARLFMTVWEAMKTNKTIYECTLVFTMPSIRRIYTYSRGVMKSGTIFPANKKVLDPTTWIFDFESVSVAGL